MKKFLERKNIVISFKRYFIDAMGAMAQGLFASLLIGTIISTIGTQTGNETISQIGDFAKSVSGPAMAIAIGYALQAPQLVLFSLLAVGAASNQLGGAGGPLAVLVIAIISAECGKAVSKETKIDIIVTPLVTITIGVLLSMLIAPYIGSAASVVGKAIMWATEQQPFIMGIIVSVVVGIALTLPISSAAICMVLGLTGLAGGAALAGCCAQMVGFAVMSFKENKMGGLLAQGIGTSMLQMGNIVKNPKIWIAPIITSAITGPIATCIFKLEMNGAAVSSGMGTCGFVGQIGVYNGWINDIANGMKAAITPMDWIGLILISFVLPAVITWILGILKKDNKKIRSKTGSLRISFMPLHVDDKQTDEHAGDRREGRQLAVIHQDCLREDLTEDDVEHCAAGKAKAQRQTKRTDFAEEESKECAKDGGYAGECGDQHCL